MRKNIFLILILFYTISGCKSNNVINTHGISYLDKREKLIFLNKSNKNDIVAVLGHPSTKGMTNNNLWIYIERTKIRINVIKLGKSYLKKNNVLLLEFNKYGILEKKDFFNIDSMKDVKFAKEITENEIKKENFIVGFLSSIKQKMESNRK